MHFQTVSCIKNKKKEISLTAFEPLSTILITNLDFRDIRVSH